MFLTTNRVAEFDIAILSRIHIILRYGDLTKDAGRKVWKQFIATANTSQGRVRISNLELECLISTKLNSRQVRDSCSMFSVFLAYNRL